MSGQFYGSTCHGTGQFGDCLPQCLDAVKEEIISTLVGEQNREKIGKNSLLKLSVVSKAKFILNDASSPLSNSKMLKRLFAVAVA